MVGGRNSARPIWHLLSAVRLSPEIVGFILAIAIGLLVGRTREPEAETEPPKPGIRDTVLISLLGALSAVISNSALTAVLLLATAAVLITMRWQHHERTGITTELASLAMFVLGYLCLTPQRTLAAGVGIVLAIVLESKQQLHQLLLKTISRREYSDTLKYLALVFVIYPLLPEGGFGPFGFFEPRKIWLFVIVISGVSFIGYFLIKFAGFKKGVLLSTLLGGLASTTAYTAAVSRAVAQTKEAAGALAGATLLANAMLLPRALFIIFVVNRALAKAALPMLAAMMIAGVVASYLLGQSWSRSSGMQQLSPVFQNPFTLGPALRLGAVFTVVLFITRAGQHLLGSKGQLLTSGIGGLIDVDAVLLTLAESAKAGEFPYRMAMEGILIAILANSAFKTGIAVSSRNSAYFLRVAGGLASIMAVGAFILWMYPSQ
jgi:uncharacterized membrane protein (DUF4010 family)